MRTNDAPPPYTAPAIDPLTTMVNEVERLQTWLKLIGTRARGWSNFQNANEDFKRIADWADAALRGEKR